MALSVFLAEAGLLDLSLSFLAEIIAFVVMIAILGKWAYPPLMRVLEARQRRIAEDFEKAEQARNEAEERLAAAAKQLDEARAQAQEVIAGASRSGEQLRTELRQKAEEDAKRISEQAKQDIEAERQKAIDSVRGEVASLVVEATGKVLNEVLDEGRHRKLIEQAISEVSTGGGGDGERKR